MSIENEEKVEEVVEEVKEETKSVEETEVTPETPEEEAAPELEEDNEYGDSLEKIETDRKAFLKKYKSTSAFKLLVGVAGIALIAVAFLVIPNVMKDEAYKVARISLMVILSVIAVGGMFAYNMGIKSWTNKRMRKYFHEYYGALYEFALPKEDYGEVICNPDEKILDEQFINNQLWSGVCKVGSRAVTHFTYKGIDIMIADAAGQIKDGKKMKPVFVGKYLIAKSSYNSPDPIVIYIKGDKRSIPPTNLEGIKCVSDDKKMSIYSNNSSWSRFLTKKVRDTLIDLRTKNDLIDVSISIQSGIVYFCLGYDDSLMILPLEKPLNARPIKQFKKDIAPTLEFIASINK